MSTDESLAALRELHWDRHPIVTATAHISTVSLLKAYRVIKKRARRGRSSLAFWAHPLTGKSYALEVIVRLLRRDYPGCAVLNYEASSKSKNRSAESLAEQVWVPTSLGGFLESMLDELEFEPKRQRLTAGKKWQLKAALYALAVESGRFFLLIDEAQELIEAEFCWLKEIINFLCKKNIFVTVVLFGQSELKGRKALLKKGRSDLGARFIDKLFEFEGIKTVDDLRDFLKQCDEHSEYPEGSGFSYTEFLWPEAYRSGFRLASCADHLWTALTAITPLGKGAQSIKMQWVAFALGEFADLTKKKDCMGFVSDQDLWHSAVKKTEYQPEPLAT